MGEYNAFTQTYTGSDGAEVTFANGQATTAPVRSNEFQAETGFEVPGDVMSTAKNPSGSAVMGRKITPSDTIETHGQRMSVAIAMQLGFLTEDAAGNFVTTATGQAGAKQADAPKGVIQLASGGTVEEALANGFVATPDGEAALATIIGTTHSDTQIAALTSFLQNDGVVDDRVLARMASQASVEPGEIAATIERAHAGMQEAVLKHLAPHGVYDHDAFTNFLHSDSRIHSRLMQSVRDLVTHNSTVGLETLAAEFAESADIVDPVNVEWALEDEGIPFTRNPRGGLVLDFTKEGYGQMPFKQALRAGLIKLEKNTGR
jgi:hypothetical protein